MKSFVRNHAKAGAGIILGSVGLWFSLTADYRNAAVFGVVLVVLAGQMFICDMLVSAIRQSPGRQMYDRGFELGERKGYQEGRRSAKPVVVPMPARSEDNASIPFFSR